MIFRGTHTYEYMIRYSSMDWLLRVQHRPGLLARLLGARPRHEEYIGGGSTWYYFPGFRRVPRRLTPVLAGLWRYGLTLKNDGGKYHRPDASVR